MRCENCGKSLRGGKLVLPWAHGNNSSAFIICPHCGCKNIAYGFGGDDDD